MGEAKSKIAVLWFGPGKNLTSLLRLTFTSQRDTERHPRRCGNPPDFGLGLWSTPLHGRQQWISEPEMTPASCVFCSQGKSQSNVKHRELHGEGGHTLKERTDKPTFPGVTCLFVSKDTCPALFWNW